MANELWAGIPLLILIAGALITKRIMEPALISSVVAVAMLEGGNFVNGYVGKMYEVLSNPSYQLLVFRPGICRYLCPSGKVRRYAGIPEGYGEDLPHPFQDYFFHLAAGRFCFH